MPHKSLAVYLHVGFVVVYYCLCFCLLNFFQPLCVIIYIDLLVCSRKHFSFSAEQFLFDDGLFTINFQQVFHLGLYQYNISMSKLEFLLLMLQYS